MSKLPLLSSEKLIKALRRGGFEARGKSRRGSHRAFVKQISKDRKLIVIVPLAKKGIPLGTLRSILRQANLSMEDLQELL